MKKKKLMILICCWFDFDLASFFLQNFIKIPTNISDIIGCQVINML